MFTVLPISYVIRYYLNKKIEYYTIFKYIRISFIVFTLPLSDRAIEQQVLHPLSSGPGRLEVTIELKERGRTRRIPC